jgi:uncharacterized protein YjbI with pentapeptide repeats
MQWQGMTRPRFGFMLSIANTPYRMHTSSALIVQGSVLMHCYLARSMQGSSLKSGNFTGATMIGVDLRNASMQGINLKGAQLGGTPGVCYDAVGSILDSIYPQ